MYLASSARPENRERNSSARLGSALRSFQRYRRFIRGANLGRVGEIR